MTFRIPPTEALDHLSAARRGISDVGGPGFDAARGPGTDAGGGGATRLHKLSRRQVRKQIAVDQRWRDEQGMEWRVVNPVYRAGGSAGMQGPGGRPRFVSFAQLAKHYRLVEGL